MEKNTSPVKKRILEYCSRKGLSKRRIYLETGIANGTLDKSTGLSEDNIVKFISAFPDVRVEWLISGEGKMLKEEVKVSMKEMAQSLMHLIDEREIEYERLLIKNQNLKDNKKR